MPKAVRSLAAGAAVFGALALAVDWAVRRRYRTGGPGPAAGGPWPAGDREPRSPLPTAGSGSVAVEPPRAD